MGHATAMKPRYAVLTIAGSDSGGGAGVQADARTIHALGGFACTAITAITAQNTHGVQSWRAETPRLIAAQIKAVLDDLPVRAIKTGLLPGAAAISAVADRLRKHPSIPLIVDPVIGSTSGTRFLDTRGLRALREQLLPRATVVTPNWPEAEALSGGRIKTWDDAEAAASRIAEECSCAVLLKGGHAPGDRCCDCLVMIDGRIRWFESARVKTRNVHGTGCVLSAAIATGLAQGKSLVRAVTSAREFLDRSLRANRRERWGGAGPAFPG
jgi:hydroxymethylpyrimidine/phosphomethylpyrimidine kinase